MTREVSTDNAPSDSLVFMGFERSLVNRGKHTDASNVEVSTHAEDILNFNQGREGLCLNGSSSFRIPYNPDTTLNWHDAWTICFWLKVDSNIDINRFPQILFNTFEAISASSEQTITCSFIEPNKIQFSVNMVVRESIDNSIQVGKWQFITLTHIPNNKFEIYVNNINKTDTYANNGRITPAIVESKNDIVFFKKYDNTDRSSKAIKFYGFRFYQRELTIRERNILFGISDGTIAHTDIQYENYSKITQVEPKSLASTFGGNVVKVTKQIALKKVLVHGYIHELVYANSIKSFHDTTFFNIIASEVFRLTNLDIRILGSFHDIRIKEGTVEGTIYDLIKSYISRTKHRFFVNIDRVLVMQTNSLFDTIYSFKHGVNSIITDTTQDSTILVNRVIGVSEGNTYEFTRTHAYAWSDWNFVSIYIRDAKYVKQVIVRAILDGSNETISNAHTTFPFTDTYTISSDTYTYTGTIIGDALKFKITPSNPDRDIDLSFALDIQYSFDTLFERRDDNIKSIKRHGVRSKIVRHNSDSPIPYDDIVRTELTKGVLRLSYKIEAPQILKHLRVGDFCVLNNPLKNISNQIVQITKIQWLYPDGKTILWCGDTSYDVYSTYTQLGDAIKSVLTAPSNIPIVADLVNPENLIDNNA